MQWLLPGNKELPQIIREQAMSNLIGVEHYSSSITLNFLDEIIGQEERWVLDFVSMSAAEIVITSIRSPWEELFQFPYKIWFANHKIAKTHKNTNMYRKVF